MPANDFRNPRFTKNEESAITRTNGSSPGAQTMSSNAPLGLNSMVIVRDLFARFPTRHANTR